MIRHRDIEQLQRLSQAPGNTLTVYLDVDQAKPANRKRGFETQLKDLLKQLIAQHPGDEELMATAQEVEDIVKRVEPNGKTLVLFRHRRLGFTFRNVLKLSLPPAAYWGRGAVLRPLVEVLDEHERYAVVLVDSQRARLCTVWLGEIEEHKDMIAFVPPRPDSPSSDKLRSQSRMERHHDESVSAHVKTVARELSRLVDELEVDRLVLGGNGEVANALARALPKRLQGRLVEILPIPVSASHEEILQRTKEVQERLERVAELEVVRDLLREVRKGGRAVAGLPATLDAVNAKPIWKLVYVGGLSLEGQECSQCHGLFTMAEERCPQCGNTLHAVDKLLDRLSQKVLEGGGTVEVVRGPAAETLRQVGDIAAILRG
ncbi:MAG: Vms1/Ankzf1 family peptidyl-tRNA hydrolase [Thermoanaerobaculum sp.]|nr:Vms1/Ankzf1 family peptidyl-tRNA hydrolase [Thermoanaerobaculum sp.]